MIFGRSRGVQPAQQTDQPTHVWPIATQFNDSNGRTWVLSSLTRPHAVRLLVFCFKTRDTPPEPSPLPFSVNYYEFLTNFNEISSRSGPNPLRSSEILPLSNEIRFLSQRIRLDFCPRKKTWDPPEIDVARIEKSDQISGLVSGQILIHLAMDNPRQELRGSSGGALMNVVCPWW